MNRGYLSEDRLTLKKKRIQIAALPGAADYKATSSTNERNDNRFYTSVSYFGRQ